MRGRAGPWLVLAGLAALPLAALIAAFAGGAVLDLSRWRDAVAQHASAGIGRAVLLQGALQLQLGLVPVLRVGGVELPSPPGFDAPALARVGEAKLRIDLLEALRGRLQLRGIEGRDIGLWLERTADGRGNWGGALPRDPASAPGSFGLGPIALHRVSIRVHDARSGARRSFELDTLHAHVAPDEPWQLTLRGRDDLGAPFRLQAGGGPPPRGLFDDAAPWPFRLEVAASHLWLQAGGEWDGGRGEARFDFDAHADDLAAAGRRWGLDLPAAAAVTLRGHAVAAARAVDLALVQGRLGDVEAAGRLILDLEGTRPHLKGRLQVDAFDWRPWRAAAEPAAPVDDGWRRSVPRFDRLPLDIDLGLDLRRWTGLPVEVRDLSVELQADGRGLRAPFRALLAGAALTGRLDLDTSAPAAKLVLQLAARDLAFDERATGPPAAPSLEGRLGQVALRLAGRGVTWAALAQDLDVVLVGSALGLQIRRAAEARPVELVLDRLSLTAGRGEPLRGAGGGRLDGEPLRIALRGGSLGRLLHTRTLPLEAELALAPARLRIAGAIGAPAVIGAPAAARGIDLRLDLQASRSGDLARWLPVSPRSGLPLALHARWRSGDDGWDVDEAMLRLGRSDLRVDARQRLVDGKPLTSARVRGGLIDAAELATLADPAPSSGAAFVLPDGDLDLNLQRLRIGSTELQDLALAARVRDGRLLPVTASGRVAGADFAARGEIGHIGATPSATLDLSTGAIDIGALLRGLGVARDIDGQVDGLRLTLAGWGRSPDEWARHADLEASVGAGRITVQGPAGRPLADVGVRHALIAAAAGEPVRGRLAGAIADLPLRIDLITGSFADFARDVSPLPFSMTAVAAGSRLSLEGEVALPLGSDGRLVFAAGGERLDTLSGLARVELPAWGPWSLRGPIRLSPGGYDLPELGVSVGGSRLGGRGRLDLLGPRPHLQLQVVAETVRLDDFPLPPRLIDRPEPAEPPAGRRDAAVRLAGRADRLLSAAFLRRFDASIDVKAREVLSGADRLAAGHLHLELQQGRLNLDPAHVNLGGGSLRLAMVYDPKESQLDFALAAAIERFDYGVIARRLHRSADMSGLVSLDMKLEGTAPALDRLLPRASGRLDFAVWPTALRSGIFNTWSSNLLLTLLPRIDPRPDPQLNCIVGRFGLDDGRLVAETMMIDTTSVRIRGEGEADLATEQLGFVFRPRAKGIGLVRLQTPLRVGGTFYDQRFYVTDADMLESVLRLIAAPVLLPMEWLRHGPQRRDGADVCADPLRPATR